MNKITAKKPLVIFVIGSLALVSVWVLAKVQTFIKKGLSDSQKVRIGNSCPAEQQSENPRFSGCNTII